MDKIIINKSEKADSRTTDFTKVSRAELLKATNQHIADVRKGMDFFAEMIKDAGKKHDWLKTSDFDGFYRDFKGGFKNDEWWKKHQKYERHHLSTKSEKYIQEDVNLVDVIEMIVDNVMAGLARSGQYRKEEIPGWLLRKAFNNTITLLLNNVTVKPEKVKIEKWK